MKTISEVTILAQYCGAQLELGMPSKFIFTEGDLMTFVRAIAKEACDTIDDGDGSMSSMAEHIWREICQKEIQKKFGL
jgi:hypothetical protein